MGGGLGGGGGTKVRGAVRCRGCGITESVKGYNFVPSGT